MKKRICTLFGFFLAAISQGQTLQSYLEEAEANNPEIQAFELKYNISREKSQQADALPNMEVSAGVFVSEPETRTGAQKARFSVRQMLPWFGTLTAREGYANALAEIDYLDMVIVKRKLRLSIAQSYYALYANKEVQEVLDRNIQLLRTYEKLALTAVEVGNASAVDVLKLQIRQNELQAQSDILKQDFQSQTHQFNTLLNRDTGLEIALADTLEIGTGIEIEGGTLDVHPELEKYDKLYESVTQSEILNQKETQPGIGFGLDYIPVAERPGMDFSDNGKDVVMPMVSFSIPVFNAKYKSRSVENELRQEELNAQKVNRRNVLESALNAALHSREAARIRFKTQQQNLRQANDAEEILIKNYETGTIDFNDILDIQELQLKFEVQQINAVEQYYAQMAIINYLTNG
ncbi:TolC family protein [Robiginitalea sp.]|jgi:outer membrane protein TolC|uniref:TolC family protein n=1 Tax=Robiginitalea sp. TaxID=1902411 RepID=UPI003C73C01A